MRSRLWQLRLENHSFSVQVSVSWYTKYILAAPGKAAGQLVGFGVAAIELGIGWVSVWVSVWALQIYDSAILACDNNLDLMCVFMASGGIGFSSSVSVYNGFGLRNKLRDGPLHNEKARGIFFSPIELELRHQLDEICSECEFQSCYNFVGDGLIFDSCSCLHKLSVCHLLQCCRRCACLNGVEHDLQRCLQEPNCCFSSIRSWHPNVVGVVLRD